MSAPGLQTLVRTTALALPEAWEDFPWGHCVVKVGKKIFVFLGEAAAMKLPDSLEEARGLPGVVPTGYGLGRSGWVNVPLDGSVPEGLVLDWLMESYRAIAPKRLATLTEELGAPPGKRLDQSVPEDR